MPRRPVIGITPEEMDGRGNMILPRQYADAVAAAGGLPVILPVWQAPAQDLLALCSGLILSGGSDVDPALYGGEGHPAIYGIDRARDDAEIALFRLAMLRRMPVFAICRGMQVMNVALGGTLHAHLPDLAGSTVAHRAEPYGGVQHPVCVEPGSLLAAIIGEAGGATVSWHHQAVDRPAPALRVAARAADGCIEAVEFPQATWCLGVQWHPELTAASDPAQQRLFDALVAASLQQAAAQAQA